MGVPLLGVLGSSLDLKMRASGRKGKRVQSMKVFFMR